MRKDFLSELSSLDTFRNIKKDLSSSLAESNQFYTSILPGSFKSLIIPTILSDYSQILILLPKRLDVNEMTVELSILGMENKIVAIDNIEIDNIQERLTAIKNKKECIIISTYKLLNVKLPSKSEIDKSTTQIEVGSDITYDDLVEYLDELKYEHEKFVTDPGYYAVRGSIIDFWSYSEEHPCRIEFDGDFLESIRFFEPESQRSTGRIESVTLATSIETDDISFDSDIFDYLDKPLVFASSFELKQLNNQDQHKLTEKMDQDDLDDDLRSELLENSQNPEEFSRREIDYNEITESESLFQKNAYWFIEDLVGDNTKKQLLNITSAPVINSNFNLLFNNLKEYAEKDITVYLTAENEIQARRLFDLLSSFNEDLNDLLETGKVKIKVLPIKEGFYLREENILLLTDYEVFNKPYRTKISKRQRLKKSRVKEFASLKIGDFIVHENFGIGKYSGLETIKIGMVEQDLLLIPRLEL